MPFFFFKKKQDALKHHEQKSKTENSKKIGLALGGGGARGFAHLGAFKAFEEEGIEFDIVSGTSVGSIAGALYCYGVSADDMIDAAKNISVSDIRDKRIIPSPSDPENIGSLLKNLVGDITFETLTKPLHIVTVDLITATEKVISSGSIARAVSASCAVPGFFRPMVWGGGHYVDGGLLNNIPADVLRVRGADYVVAVDINSSRKAGTPSLKTLDVLSASMRISLVSASTKGIMASDVVIRPDTKRFSSKSKEGYEEMIEEGYLAAKELAARIKKLRSGEEINRK